MHALHVQLIKTETLIPYAQNARKHPKQQIRQVANSIEQFGFLVPVLIDGSGGIIAGHCRVEAAKNLGIQQIPCIRVEHLTEVQKRAFILADNKLTENARWDDQVLAQELKELSCLDLSFDLEITGFHSSEIDDLIEQHFQILPEEAEEDFYDPAASAPDKTVTSIGDVWVLGDHKIMCGDALKAECYATLFEDEKAQMVFTDPPYNVPVNGHICGLGRTQHKEFSMASGEMSPAQFTTFLQTAFQRMTSASEDGSIHYIFMDWRHMTEILAAGQSCYTELKNLCVWVKDNAGMGSFYRSKHELIFIFKHGTAPHINNFELGQHGRHRSNVWKYPGVNSFTGRNSKEGNLLQLHPTVKPIKLVEDAIRDCSQRNGIVLDPFLGSGTTLLAAEKSARRCYGIELDSAYVDTAIRRWQKLTAKEARRLSCGTPFNVLEQQINPEIAHA